MLYIQYLGSNSRTTWSEGDADSSFPPFFNIKLDASLVYSNNIYQNRHTNNNLQ